MGLKTLFGHFAMEKNREQNRIAMDPFYPHDFDFIPLSCFHCSLAHILSMVRIFLCCLHSLCSAFLSGCATCHVNEACRSGLIQSFSGYK